MTRRVDAFGHEDHELLGAQVRDTVSGKEGVLAAVVVERVRTHCGTRLVRQAYIKDSDGVEWTTSPSQVSPVTPNHSPSLRWAHRAA
ncbi:hypothetical protein CLM85_15860 [Streptomyces albidoflavus]|uniref:hypothetical protein n=1 Tax=Streptomyces albidoflavus TaxID=1886 RepID=UPI000BADF7BB|nr:hypothetical protein [Streptomyces albidoflavus]PAX83400.1 hypothetical protein CLM81_22520 [Streptomyces albidoflavus]PBO16216.1 hypothetical protein CLM83_25115 [Streptomyces albidoflavus]PBO23447.1 hypothetical protein CLM85_15860 [Streptomyces albidoflavus]PBO28916.1 hypothetical protein CLM84_17020 [Streptomyces albidoflavus]